MSRYPKLGIIVAGYVTAFVVAYLAVHVRQLQTRADPLAASSGMYAFGDLSLFLAVFGFVALAPTGLGLYYLRPVRRLWAVWSIGCMALAGTGLVAALVIMFVSHDPRWGVAVSFAVLRMFGAPLLAPLFMLTALIAPTRRTRLALLSATAVEAAVSIYTVLHWFVLPHVH
jgi:hypothetical protein